MATVIDVQTHMTLGGTRRTVTIGTATPALDEIGRRVLEIRLAMVPADGRVFLSLAEVITVASEQTNPE